MRIAGKELKKLLCSPFLWFIFIVFLGINWLQVYASVGGEFTNQQYRVIHDIIVEHGINHIDVTDIRKPSDSEYEQVEYESKVSTDIMAFYYRDYVENNSDLYEKLDLHEILQTKLRITDYQPKGYMKKFIEGNYNDLQERANEIKREGRDLASFYPGRDFQVHSLVFGRLGRSLILEIIILSMLCLLYLMDYERIQKNRDIVLASKIGKGLMYQKIAMGILGALVFSLLLIFASYGIIFHYIPFHEFWKVPVEACLVTEPRYFNMFYPYITFWNLTMGQYLLTTILVDICLIILAAGLIAAVQLILQNSYVSFCFTSLSIFLLYWSVQLSTGYFIDVIKALFNPVELYITCGAWFMENDITLGFAGNEFWILACSGAWVLLIFLVGRKRYLTSDVG